MPELVALTLWAWSSVVLGMDNGAGKTPPLGLSTWTTCGDAECTHDFCNEEEVKESALAMQQNGMQCARLGPDTPYSPKLGSISDMLRATNHAGITVCNCDRESGSPKNFKMPSSSWRPTVQFSSPHPPLPL